MNFLKNRTVLGVICIAIALVICFLITPLFNASASKTTEIIRMKTDVKVGQEITEKDIETVEVGAYNLPSDVIRSKDEIVGKYVASELVKGEYVLPAKISDTPANENNYLYGLTGETRAISITIPSFAAGLSGKLQSGDIVSVIACDYRDSGETVVPDELQYVEVIAATDKSGSDKGDVVVTADGEEKAELPSTITLLVSPMQANILAELEADRDIHAALVYRGTAENAAEFIKAQEAVLSEIEEKILAEKEKEEAENTANSENTEESEGNPTENILTETDDTTENNNADTEENTDAEFFE